MGQLWILVSGIGCLLLGISAQRLQNTVNSPENRHLRFSNSYYKVLTNGRTGNLATSPLGIDELLLMISFGVNYNHVTFKELNNTVQLPAYENEFIESHRSVTELLDQNPSNVELTISNRMYVNKNSQILPTYQSTLNQFFRTQCNEIDFTNPGTAVQLMNNEVARLTRNRIRNTISPSVISQDTSLLLMNVLYFKGKWKTPFKTSLTRSRPFSLNKNDRVNVSTMYIEQDFKRFYDSEMRATVVEMPYQNEDFSMVIILPDESISLEAVENKLQLPALWIKLANAFEQLTELSLPKFKIESSLDLKPTLQKMGIRYLFSTHADLSLMSRKESLYVSEVQQKVFLEVNEEGSEAAAVSYATVPLRSSSDSVVRVNRPFLAILRYKDLNLFTARITDPRDQTTRNF